MRQTQMNPHPLRAWLPVCLALASLLVSAPLQVGWAMAGAPPKAREATSPVALESGMSPATFIEFRRFSGLIAGPFVPLSWAEYRLDATFRERPGRLFIGLVECLSAENDVCWLEVALAQEEGDEASVCRLLLDGKSRRITRIEALDRSCVYRPVTFESDMEENEWKVERLSAPPTFLGPQVSTPLGPLSVVWRKLVINATPTYLAESAEILPLRFVKAVAPYQAIVLQDMGRDWPAKRHELLRTHSCSRKLLTSAQIESAQTTEAPERVLPRATTSPLP